MNFLSRIFLFEEYYYLFKILFTKIGFDYYKGLNNKLPPIRYLGKDINNNELVILAHPKDFIKKIKEIKNIFNNQINLILNYKVKINEKINEIYEIYPSINELPYNPNGFIGLFVNRTGMEIIKKEFNKNNEVNRLKFIKIRNINNIKISNVLNIFYYKFTNNNILVNKYKNLYLTIGEMNSIDIKSNTCYPTNVYNILGGKRLFNENSLQATIRESIEELGLTIDSKLSEIIKYLIYNTNDIIDCNTFNIYCIFFAPNNLYNYSDYIENSKKKSLLVNINDI